MNTQESRRRDSETWEAARSIIATVYPETECEYSQAGPALAIKLNSTTGLMWGVAFDTIGANVYDIIGDEWELTNVDLDTPLSSDSDDAEAIAAAILKETLAYHHDVADNFASHDDDHEGTDPCTQKS